MSRLRALFCCLVLAAPCLRAADAVEINVKFKTVDKNERNFDGPRGGDRNVEEKSKVMEITITAQQPAGVGPAKVEYWAVELGIKGKERVAAKGNADLTLALRKAQVVTSTPFVMLEKHTEGARGRNGNHAEAEISDYVVRVTNAKGDVLAEKMTSADAKSAILEAKPARRK